MGWWLKPIIYFELVLDTHHRHETDTRHRTAQQTHSDSKWNTCPLFVRLCVWVSADAKSCSSTPSWTRFRGWISMWGTYFLFHFIACARSSNVAEKLSRHHDSEKYNFMHNAIWSLCLPISTIPSSAYYISLHLLKQGKTRIYLRIKLKVMANIVGKFMEPFSISFFFLFSFSFTYPTRGVGDFLFISSSSSSSSSSHVNCNVFGTPIPPLTDYKFYFMHIFKFINKRVRTPEQW